MTLQYQKPLREFRRQLIDHFNLDQIQTFAIDLGLDWTSLNGEGISTKTQSLLNQLMAERRLPELVLLLQEEKPEVSWSNIGTLTAAAADEPAHLSEDEQKEAVQRYKENLTALLRTAESTGKEKKSPLQAIALQETTEILPKLDGRHKGSVLRFLQETNLLATGTDSLIFERVNLQGVVLAKANLRGMNLNRARLRQADLSHCDLRSVNLGGAELRGADLSQANLEEARLWGADLHGANLRGANLRGARLSGADLRRADLGWADLNQAYFWDTDLSGANLYQAINVTDQQLSFARSLKEAKLPDGRQQGS